VLILTRELVRPHLARVTVAAITSTIRGGCAQRRHPGSLRSPLTLA
jgi:mRNA-degrading endonuclease toxin of MazEF toxin-antitoxin module